MRKCGIRQSRPNRDRYLNFLLCEALRERQATHTIFAPTTITIYQPEYIRKSEKQREGEREVRERVQAGRFIIWRQRTAGHDGRYDFVDDDVAVDEEGDQDIDLGTGISSPFPVENEAC